MGIINATQDSFSGDGVAGDLDKAVALAKKFEANGVDVIDVGGASSRPGADPTPIKEELARVVPVIEAIHAEVELPISIDTTWATVAEAALGAGATILNDISGLQADPELASAWHPFGAVAGAVGAPWHHPQFAGHRPLRLSLLNPGAFCRCLKAFLGGIGCPVA